MTLSKEFVCKIDGTSFASRQEMMDHLNRNYVKVMDTPLEFKEVELKLKTHFPDFMVETLSASAFKESERLDFRSKLFKKEKVVYCRLHPTTFKGSICFAISPSFKDTFNEDLRVYRSVEKAISSLETLLTQIDLFSKEALQLVQSYDSSVVSLSIHELEEQHISDYYGGEEHYFSLSYHAFYKDGKSKHFTTISIPHEELDDKKCLQQQLTSSLQHVKGRYVMSVEGDVVEKEPNDYYSLEYYYEVDGIELDSLARRAERLRVTILE